MNFKRYKQNPILKPIENNSWESGAVFNCGAVYDKGRVHLLYRAIAENDKDYISRLGYAVSRDGINFERKTQPVFEPKESYEKWGCEDPRITKIKDKFYLTYAAPSSPAPSGGHSMKTALAETYDFSSFKRLGVITPEKAENKDVVLFPEKIQGKYFMLHRPCNWVQPHYSPAKPSIWGAYSNNLKDWSGDKVLMEPKEDWEASKIGAGPPPIKTDKGWLLIYHGVSRERGIKKYKAGAALLDIKDPFKVLARTKIPLLEPEKDYEIFGDSPNTSNVVFPEGMVVINKETFLYYGAADKTCCLATCPLDELLNFLLEKNRI